LRWKRRQIAGIIAIILIGIAGIVTPPYIRYLLTQILIFGIFAIAFDLLFGYTGLLSLGHAMFFGIGAYGAALSMIHFHVNIFVAILIGIVIGTLFSIGIGVVCIRMRDVFFLILTFIFSLIIYLVSLDFVWLTGGDDGINFERPELKILTFKLSLYDEYVRYYFVLIIFLISYLIIYKISNSPTGLAFKAIRENEDLAKALGYDVSLLKLKSFVLSGLFASLAGAIYSLSFGYANAELMSLDISLRVIVWTLFGGAGTLIGPVIGTGILTYVFDVISSITRNHPIILGILLIAVMVKFKGGLYNLADQLYNLTLERVSR